MIRMIFKTTEEYNSGKQSRTLIVFDDMIADIAKKT